jgi:hypothetical protein
MGRTRLRTAVITLLVCVPALALAAWPALGWQANLRRVTESVSRNHGHDAVWSGGIRITGKVQVPLRPGVTSPIRIKINNPNPKTVSMQRVRVRIAGISAPHANATHTCTKADFLIHQMPKLALHVPAGRTTDLAGLGLATAKWPTIAMRNLPRNQDGCKGATLTLHFRAARTDKRVR